MKFESAVGITVETVPRPTLYKIIRGESYWQLSLDEAVALANRLRDAIDYEIGQAS